MNNLYYASFNGQTNERITSYDKKDTIVMALHAHNAMKSSNALYHNMAGNLAAWRGQLKKKQCYRMFERPTRSQCTYDYDLAIILTLRTSHGIDV
jgi:hypothetical protein